MVFDWDGTLYNSMPLLREAWDATCDTFNIPRLTEEKFTLFSSRSANQNFEDLLGSEKMEEGAAVFYEFVEWHEMDTLTPMQGAQDVLQALHGAEIPMAVISFKRHHSLRQMVDKLGWGDYFYDVVGRYDDMPHLPLKPQKEIYNMVAAKWPRPDISPERVWIVGDGFNDIKLAKNIGSISVGFGTRFAHHNLKGNDAPDFHVNDMSELLDVLQAK